MALKYTKHENIRLKKHPDFSEVWLHDRICGDTSILGLGDLDVIERERNQFSGGRLDVLLGDSDNTRYEVEIMLGKTDPSHIIRCIEYWDIERRRYPAYDHVAVLVAEEVTTRFLNVMGLLAGSIPLVAIQLNALKVGDQVLLDFVKVLDQRALRADDTSETGGADVDRSTWKAKVGEAALSVCDEVLKIANEKSESPLTFKYKKTYIAVTTAGGFFNVLLLYPKKQWAALSRKVSNAAEWKERLEEAGLPADLKKGGARIWVTLTAESLEEHKTLVSELIHHAVDDYQA